MALLCVEHRHDFKVGDKIYGALLQDGTGGAALCERALSAIPVDERFAEQIKGGVDIHTGTSKANLGGYGTSVSEADLKYGRRLFSISRATLIRYLPKAAEFLLG